MHKYANSETAMTTKSTAMFIYVSHDYSEFELLPDNRDIDTNRAARLDESISKHGTLPQFPIVCVETRRLTAAKTIVKQIIEGQHRFVLAQKHGQPIYFVLMPMALADNIDLAHLNSSYHAWNMIDYCTHHKKNGKAAYAEAMRFSKYYGLPIGTTLSLLSGETGKSSNKMHQIRSGEFTIKPEHRQFARMVAELAAFCHDEVRFRNARNERFVLALAKCATLDRFSASVFRDRFRKYGDMLHTQTTIDDYIRAIGHVYNYNAKSMAIPNFEMEVSKQMESRTFYRRAAVEEI